MHLVGSIRAMHTMEPEGRSHESFRDHSYLALCCMQVQMQTATYVCKQLAVGGLDWLPSVIYIRTSYALHSGK